MTMARIRRTRPVFGSPIPMAFVAVAAAWNTAGCAASSGRGRSTNRTVPRPFLTRPHTALSLSTSLSMAAFVGKLQQQQQQQPNLRSPSSTRCFPLPTQRDWISLPLHRNCGVTAGKRRAPRTRLQAAATPPAAGTPLPPPRLPPLHVRLDQPLLPPDHHPLFAANPTVPVQRYASWSSMTKHKLLLWLHSVWQAAAAVTRNKTIRVAAATFCLAFVVSFALRQSGPLWKRVVRSARIWNGKLQNAWDQIQATRGASSTKSKSNLETFGVPMPFDTDDEETEGWGVCTLRSKKPFGKTNFVQYEFALPEPEYVLPLELGQTVTLCCLDQDSNVAKGDFFPFSLQDPKKTKATGTFSILVPIVGDDKDPEKSTLVSNVTSALIKKSKTATATDNSEAYNFVRVLHKEVEIGDEVALKPGIMKLAYRGQYLPVTEMVYLACGVGIVPVLDQVRAVLPNGSSSVKTVSVIWINAIASDFDITADVLEKEYFKYSSKLSVSCIILPELETAAMITGSSSTGTDDHHPSQQAPPSLLLSSSSSWLANSAEVTAAVPDFAPGIMAVVAGPSRVTDKAVAYLRSRGYPKDTICVL